MTRSFTVFPNRDGGVLSNTPQTGTTVPDTTECPYGWTTYEKGGFWFGLIFVKETGEIFAQSNEGWNSRYWLRETLETIAYRQWAAFLRESDLVVPPWLANRLQTQASTANSLRRPLMTDSSRAIKSFGLQLPPFITIHS